MLSASLTQELKMITHSVVQMDVIEDLFSKLMDHANNAHHLPHHQKIKDNASLLTVLEDRFLNQMEAVENAQCTKDQILKEETVSVMPHVQAILSLTKKVDVKHALRDINSRQMVNSASFLLQIQDLIHHHQVEEERMFL